MTVSSELDQKNETEEIEPNHPGWLPLDNILHTREPFFQKFLFMLGFDLSSNIYLIQGDYLTLVDPGNDYTAFLDLFKEYSPAAIKKVVLTHGHLDHSTGVIEIMRSYPVIFESGGFDLILHEAGPRELKGVARGFGCRVHEVRGGEILDLSGSSFEVIHTPGHTIDGLCLYHRETKTVLTGDTVQPHVMAEPDKHAGGRLDHYLIGIKELLSREIENVLPGHGSPIGSIGRRIIEETYESLMMKILGIENPIPWVEGAMSLARMGLFEEAVYCCEKHLIVRPGDVMALKTKGFCLNDLGRFGEALGSFDELESLPSVERNGDISRYMGRGYALMGLERYDESIETFDEALRLRPDLKDALMYKGMALHLAGKDDEAMKIEPYRMEFEERFKGRMGKGAQ